MMNQYLYDNTIAKEVASILVDCKAVKLSPENPFQWSSGWKSPIYCDNRVSLSFPSSRKIIKDHLANLIKDRYPQAEAIAGVATAGIPQGALVADVLSLPFLYVRSKPKGHGMTNQIEGRVVEGQNVVMVEDLISTGGSSLAAVKALKESDVNVIGLVAIFNYGFEIANKNFADQNVPFCTLSDYSTLIEMKSDDLTPAQIQSLNEWRTSPETWHG